MRTHSRKRVVATLIAACLALTVVACGTKVTQENYDLVKSGMTKDEAISILGQPDRSSDVSLGPLSGTTATWDGDEISVTIQFVNEKVALKELERNN